MEISAKLNYLRIAPRKVRLLADLVRGKNVQEARSLLDFSLQKSAGPMVKLLNSAVANAKNNFSLEEQGLYISEIKVDEGPKLKRWRARSRGRAYHIQKKTSHITLILDSKILRGEKTSGPLVKKEKEKLGGFAIEQEKEPFIKPKKPGTQAKKPVGKPKTEAKKKPVRKTGLFRKKTV